MSGYFACIYVCIPCSDQKRTDSFRNWSYKRPPCGYWKSNPAPLEERPVFLKNAPSLKPPTEAWVWKRISAQQWSDSSSRGKLDSESQTRRYLQYDYVSGGVGTQRKLLTVNHFKAISLTRISTDFNGFYTDLEVSCILYFECSFQCEIWFS